MKPPISLRAMLLLVAGTVAILLLGAFSRIDNNTDQQAAAPLVTRPSNEPPSSLLDADTEPTVPAFLSTNLTELIKLARGHVDAGVMLAFVQSSGQTYAPTADEVLYLKALGVPQTVIAAMFAHKAPAPHAETVVKTDSKPIAPVAAVASPNDVPVAGRVEKSADATDAVYQALAPFGKWITTSELGVCWQPDVAANHPNWRPYLNNGQWLYSDNGWYWQSLYTWGWLPFHYGRWTKMRSSGWVWVPDNTWGPAWVAWRQTEEQLGWAPLPPGSGVALNGLTYRNHEVGTEFDFGLAPDSFTFVNQNDFLNENPASYTVAISQFYAVYQQSGVVNNYFVMNQKIVNAGPPLAIIALKNSGAKPFAPARHGHGDRHKDVEPEHGNFTSQLAVLDPPGGYRAPLIAPESTAATVHMTEPVKHEAVIQPGAGASAKSGH